MPHAGVLTARRAAPRPALVVAVLSSVGLVASLCMTLVVPVIPQLPRLLDTSTATASWVITATLLAGAVATPIAGRLGDMVGKRRVLLATLGLLVVGSVLCAVTDALLPVLVGRALQGVAVSAVPLGISLMRDTLPAARLGSGIALMSATLGIGGGLGLPLSAVIVEVADWHALFWVAGGLGLAGLLLVGLVIPETTTRSGGRFDGVGAVGLSVGLIGLLLALSKGSEWGWTSATTLGSAGVAVVALLAWGAYELRTTDPLVDLRLNARRAVLLPNLISIPVGVAMFTGMVVFPQLLSAPLASGHGLGLSLLAAGLVLAPNGLVMMLMSPVTARISATAGPRASLRVGLVVIAVAYAGSTVLLTAAWQIAVVISVIGAGVALA
ncbi:MAG TPA: MFS transporter, partial [Actinomycetospora sp.]|nr:MFS transporter [Actinomycetospora sp.]